MIKVRVLFDGGMQVHDAGVQESVTFAVNDKGVMLCMAGSKLLAAFDATLNQWVVEGVGRFRYARVDMIQE